MNYWFVILLAISTFNLATAQTGLPKPDPKQRLTVGPSITNKQAKRELRAEAKREKEERKKERKEEKKAENINAKPKYQKLIKNKKKKVREKPLL